MGMGEIQNARVLLVDDDISLLRTMAFVFKRKGCSVAAAQSGAEALRMVEKRPFDVIFMDVRMPEMNGVECYEQIKEIRPDATVVMMTAYAVEDLVREALQEGAYGVVYKPLDMDEMLQLAEEIRERRTQKLK